MLFGAGSQTILGGAGRDTIWGGADNDTLTGGANGDYFWFGEGFGSDTITDFSIADGDRIRITNYTQWQSLEQVGADTVIHFSATDMLTLRNIFIGSVTAGLFQFGAAMPQVDAIAPPPADPGRPNITPNTRPFVGFAVQGAAANDVLIGTDAPEYLYGQDGDDIINGGNGQDSLQSIGRITL